MPTLEAPLQRLPRYLTQTEIEAFFRTITSVRDLALFGLLYLYGLRVSEVSLLLRRDVDLARSRFVVKRLKGGVWAERPLFSSARTLLAAHLASLGPAPGSAPLFPGNGGPLRKRQIQALFTRYRDRAGLPGHITCHSLRHSIATHLLDAGASLEFVQDHLGHQSIRSTSIYARITDRHRRALYRKLESSPWIVCPDGPGREGHQPRKEGIP
ncbi:MAG: tyrosine-type recombinase/integrase [Candidatus Eisenbacteria bacterium]